MLGGCTTVLTIVAVLAWLAFRVEPPANGNDAAAPGAVPAVAGRSFTPPAVEPVEYLDVEPDDARAINAAVPFADRANPAATPYRLTADIENSARAVDCLAAAAWYEAGDDPVGQAAVVQVVLNRARHPSFPKSVCGVVFQGSERATGCQFTFTCDGALRRVPSAPAWQRARAVALAGLSGRVFPTVGWSTHYHTDWVVPYWSRSVDKTAVVGTHIFFRWRGVPGTPGAFAGRVGAAEPVIAKLAALSPAHAIASGVTDTATTDVPAEPAMSAPGPAAPVPPPIPAATLRGSTLTSRDLADNRFTVAVRPDAFAGDLAVMAIGLCAAQPQRACTVVGRIDGGSTTDFYYTADRARGVERVLWHCACFPRKDPRQCLPEGFKPD